MKGHVRVGALGFGALLSIAGVSGCFGDSFAGVTVENACDVPIQAVAEGYWTSDATVIRPGDTFEILDNAPPGASVRFQVGPVGGPEPAARQERDGALVRVSGPDCPA